GYGAGGGWANAARPRPTRTYPLSSAPHGGAGRAENRVRKESDAPGARPPRTQPGAELGAPHRGQARARRHDGRAGRRRLQGRVPTAGPGGAEESDSSEHCGTTQVETGCRRQKTFQVKKTSSKDVFARRLCSTS